MKNIQMDLFVRKIDTIRFLKESYHLDYKEIAYILDDHPYIIRNYIEMIVSSETCMLRIKGLKS